MRLETLMVPVNIGVAQLLDHRRLVRCQDAGVKVVAHVVVHQSRVLQDGFDLETAEIEVADGEEVEVLRISARKPWNQSLPSTEQLEVMVKMEKMEHLEKTAVTESPGCSSDCKYGRQCVFLAHNRF